MWQGERFINAVTKAVTAVYLGRELSYEEWETLTDQLVELVELVNDLKPHHPGEGEDKG